MPDMNYNPQFGGYNQSFFSPYGMGGGMPSVSSMQFGGGYPGMGNFSQAPMSTGYPSMETMGGGYAPGGFMNNFQSQLKDMFDKYFNQGQMVVDPAVGPAPTTGSATGTSTTLGSAGSTTPDFGNLGGRLDKGKGITRKTEKKLNRMGYTDDNIYNASQAGGGAQGFRNALGNVQPNYKTQTSAGTYTR